MTDEEYELREEIKRRNQEKNHYLTGILAGKKINRP